MSKILVKKSAPLAGSVTIQGAKNSVLKLMAATILAEEECTIENVPDLLDVKAMGDLLRSLGLGVVHDVEAGTIKTTPATKLLTEPPLELVALMRASIIILGPMVAKAGRIQLAMPGGCEIGSRPIDLHVKGLTALGAKVLFSYTEDGRAFMSDDIVKLASIKSANGSIIVEAPSGGLVGADIFLDFPSVGATENIMMAATLANGTTTIRNAAKEPEIIDLANFLNRMGAIIKGAGTDVVRITGVPRLGGAVHQTVPDRIIAITYMLAAVITQGSVELRNVVPDHVQSITSKLQEMGVDVEERSDVIKVTAPKERLKGTKLTTMPYPGVPTDVQAPFMALLTVSEGQSLLTENLYENRFMHVPQLNALGANIKIDEKDKHTAVITGVEKLVGTHVEATDLRCGAALVLAGLVAEGETVIDKVFHIDRGYPHIEKDLRQLGARIERIEDETDVSAREEECKPCDGGDKSYKEGPFE